MRSIIRESQNIKIDMCFFTATIFTRSARFTAGDWICNYVVRSQWSNAIHMIPCNVWFIDDAIYELLTRSGT